MGRRGKERGEGGREGKEGGQGGEGGEGGTRGPMYSTCVSTNPWVVNLARALFLVCIVL